LIIEDTYAFLGTNFDVAKLQIIHLKPYLTGHNFTT
jgi:hypothetical protein